MGLLMLMMVLAQEPELSPPPPPPPVDATRVPLDVPPPPPAPSPEPVDQTGAPVDDGGGPGFGARVATSFGLGGVGAGLATVAIYFVAGCSSRNGSDCLLLGLGATVLGFAAVVAGAYAGHRLMGGRSNLGWTLLGAGAGAIIGFTGFFLVGSSSGVFTGGSRVVAWGAALAMSLTGAIGAAFMLEVGHLLMVREHPVAVAPMLVPGGAGLAVGARF